ncbi:MAG: ATP-binding cassette domain-containing protein [Verrucomicrobiota bacterium]
MPKRKQPKLAAAENFFLELRDVHKAFGAQQVLRGMNLGVRRGETMVVIGGSGTGKSVTLKNIMGLVHPDRGDVIVDGVNIVDMPERQLSETRKKVGILFQDGALFDSMNVAENVAFPLFEDGMRDRQAIFERVKEALEVVELGEHMAKMPINLSGGMRKRVGLARAIVNRPACVLYDEPTSGLDPIVSDSINILIRRMQKTFDITSVVVTHDMKSAYHVADRIAFLREGRTYFLGTPEEIQKSDDPLIQDFIEGRSRPNGH